MRPSRQRALIALRSFSSVAAAARSLRCDPSTLMRMTIGDEELTEAYENCVYGVIRQRGEEERAATKRQRDAAKPRVSERTAERRKARLFAAAGKDPRLAAAALHKRLNHERRQEKAAAIEEAIDAVDEMIANRPVSKPPRLRLFEAFDRWCAHCKADRVDDPCEVCNRHTLEVR